MQPVEDRRGNLTIRATAAGAMLLAYVGFLPLLAYLAPSYADHDLERMAQVVVLGIVVLICGSSPSTRLVMFRSAISKALATLLCMALVASSITHLGRMSSREAALLVMLAATVLAAASVLAETGDVIALKAIVLIAAPYAALVLIVYGLALASGDSVLVTELFPGYSNYRFFSHVQTVTIPLLALAAAHSSLETGYRSMARITLAANFAFLFFCSGRATLLGLCVALVVAWIAARKAGLPWIRELLLGALAGAVLYAVLFVGLPHVLGTNLDAMTDSRFARGQSIEARWYLWRLAFDDALEAPWLGIGPMRFATRVNFEAAHPHNVYLQIAAEWGIPGLVFALCVGGVALRRLWTAERASTESMRSLVGAALLGTLVAVFIDGSLSGNFVMPMPQMWIACVFGWALAWLRATPAALSPKVFRRDPLQRAAWLVPIASFGFLLLSSLPEFLDLDHHLASIRQAAPTPRDNPRFWSDGWFGDGPDGLPQGHFQKPPYLR